MAISIDDIKKLRAMTGAGLADVKKALTEAEGDFDKAKELLRERGLAIAAKRSDRETSNGCVLVKAVDGFAAMIALKCETDFVANGADFIALTQSILDAAIANKCKDIEAVKALTINGQTAQEAVTQRSGITGGHKLAMQVAAMKPVALNAESVDQKILDEEYKTAVEKTKLEQVEKYVEVVLKKAGINPNLVDSEDHIESNMAKGWLTQEQADEARKLKESAAAEKAASLNQNMIENIAKGRVQKFLKENCLVDQEFQFGDGDKATVSQWLAQQDKELKIVDFKRFTLVAE